ncbi:hypothetical protein [Xenorhabdus thuongxuanensis]|uniref:Uncharacterized protein n=1 Tax=Xenorhabdus thuongxuanensis TaxID=1873484 RepID=A0A1Q5TMT8_9GAMM|nr:hypothetical protein [Xenorhabdus thuongxuanensis]OKP01540.1 hypothetical protein Xentx_03413 [Xenorhabdus thuongxuanensis]
MSNKNMTIKEVIEYLKENNKGCPACLLDEERAITNYPPLTDAEKMECAEYMVKRQRTLIAKEYLVSCYERFGLNTNGSFIFIHENCGVELDADAIETLLIHQIEKTILEVNPIEKYIALWRFYLGNEVNEKENSSTWMRDFIDEVFIGGFKLFTAEPASPTAH